MQSKFFRRIPKTTEGKSLEVSAEVFIPMILPVGSYVDFIGGNGETDWRIERIVLELVSIGSPLVCYYLEPDLQVRSIEQVIESYVGNNSIFEMEHDDQE